MWNFSSIAPTLLRAWGENPAMQKDKTDTFHFKQADLRARRYCGIKLNRFQREAKVLSPWQQAFSTGGTYN
jgi:hypothetical protein